MPGAVVGSIVWPVILFVAIEILVRVAWPLGRQWAVLRFGGMIPVALVAGVVSYRHLSSLLTYYGEDRLVSALGPLAIDGLMIMATGALLVIGHRTSTPVQDASPTPEPVPDARRRPQDVPAPSPTSLPVPDERSPHVPAVPQTPRPSRPSWWLRTVLSPPFRLSWYGRSRRPSPTCPSWTGDRSPTGPPRRCRQTCSTAPAPPPPSTSRPTVGRSPAMSCGRSCGSATTPPARSCAPSA
ncbi:hypothetical protein ACFQZ4_53695 [Catellatospora coxensis]